MPSKTSSPLSGLTASLSASLASENEAAKTSAGKLDWKARKEEQAKQRKRQNDLKKTEEKIHLLEERDNEINGLLTQQEIYTDVSRLMELNREKEQIGQELEKLYELWAGLAEEEETQ